MAKRGRLEQCLGEVIRERRLAAGLSQGKLAEAADLHRNQGGLIERGTISASVASLQAIAKAIGTRASELIEEAERRDA